MAAVSVFMDVEDPINALADDAALDLARLFTEAGVRGSFCLTGDKCRTLAERGRMDVAEAFSGHCLGLHTNGHSRHPTTMELLADLPFDAGCRAAYDEERKGFDAFVALFGRTPSFWGGAGNTWSPELTDALRKLGIPAYTYALTALPGDAVHRFNGVLALPQAISVSEAEWQDDERSAEAAVRVIARLREEKQPWIGLFVGHPTRMRYSDYWDHGYYHGRTPEVPLTTEPLPVEVYERGKRNLALFLGRLRSELEIVGADEAVGWPWRFREPSVEERLFFEGVTSENLRAAISWPPNRRGLDPENIVRKTLALAETLEVGCL